MYIEQPPGFETHDKKTYVCQLNKELYVLKKASRAWYKRIDGFLIILGFTKMKTYFNLYYKVEDEKIVILLLYVDDLLL